MANRKLHAHRRCFTFVLQAGDIQWENGTNRSADGNELFSETVVDYSIADVGLFRQPARRLCLSLSRICYAICY